MSPGGVIQGLKDCMSFLYYYNFIFDIGCKSCCKEDQFPSCHSCHWNVMQEVTVVEDQSIGFIEMAHTFGEIDMVFMIWTYDTNFM